MPHQDTGIDKTARVFFAPKPAAEILSGYLVDHYFVKTATGAKPSRARLAKEFSGVLKVWLKEKQR